MQQLYNNNEKRKSAGGSAAHKLEITAGAPTPSCFFRVARKAATIRYRGNEETAVLRSRTLTTAAS